jgi:hypothetical protein
MQYVTFIYIFLTDLTYDFQISWKKEQQLYYIF